ncbi:glycoside hydrolase family 3 N-terminal domain-containing protein [Saccharopolyspora halophila]|uniref:beta-glucosidase n=1 Tax=Saccharopolyspora halophila TaxID=405551 RepID=A0ABN3GKB9_9PSEU
MARCFSGRARLLVAGLAVACTTAFVPAAAATQPEYLDKKAPVADRVDDLMSRMTLEDKIGQMTQAERASADPQTAADARLGSILSGGGSGPETNNAKSWADMYDAYQKAATSTPLGIPVIYGVDAVHGHNNVHGATIFPHNIGLGAANDPQLAQDIGRATAEEVAGTGIDWNFAPCLCVARDDRWGRTYESFGETPERPTAMTSVIDGLQGRRLDGPASVLATAKHYIGDGGTTGGDDQGNAEMSEQELREVHLPPFKAAIERGAGSVMISYSSWNGEKLHASDYLINDVLKGELGYSGFVLSDYDAIDKIDGQEGFTAEEVRDSINAGIDMVMISSEWRKFVDTLKGEVEAGRVPMERIDDANRRILTKKFELGLFEKPFTERKYTRTVGSQEHRDLARQAVRESQVLLKNDGDVLPLAKNDGKLFVAGKNADDIGNQSGGWTMTWQGESGPITPGTTILEGIRQVAGERTEITYDRHGRGVDDSYDAAIAVVGETPYAEYEGDRPDGLGLDQEDLATLSRLEASGVPVIAVTVSGRPLDIAEHVSNWDALVASWLPGTEGAGVADVLFGDYNPTGTLPMTWMSSFDQQPINDGDGQRPLFPYGFGLRYE